MLTASGSTAEQALAEAALCYADTTIRAMGEFFDNRMRTGEVEILLESEGNSNGKKMEWKSISSRPHFDSSGEIPDGIEDFLSRNPCLALAGAELVEELNEPALYFLQTWIRSRGQGEIEAKILVNGEVANPASGLLSRQVSEMNFGEQPWEMRQFIILQPQECFDSESWRTDSRDPISGGKGHDSYATSAAGVKLETVQYLKYDFATGCFVKLAGGGVIAGTICLLFKWWVAGISLLLLGMLPLGIALLALRSSKQKFHHALLVPGMVVRKGPAIGIVVMAPLASSKFSPTRGMALKLISIGKLPHHTGKVGERIPCVASFSKGDRQGYWGNFIPEPIAFGTRDPKEVFRCYQKIRENEFALLEEYVAEGKYSEKENELFKIDDLPSHPPPLPARRF